jgi:hypothetical protein
MNYIKDPKFKRLERGETLTIFFIDKDVVDKNEWTVIRESNMVLKRYEFNTDDKGDIYYP